MKTSDVNVRQQADVTARLNEVAEILATGFLRLQQRADGSRTDTEYPDSGLDICRDGCVDRRALDGSGRTT